jgi:glutamine amidotransferase
VSEPIVVVDYGMGNLASVCNAFERLGMDSCLSDRSQDIATARRLVLPGVGAFGDAVDEIDRRRLREPIVEAVQSGAALLGICLGMQLLFDESDENSAKRGLALLRGRVKRLPGRVRVPHVGWNRIESLERAPILSGMGAGDYLYFVHSYYVEPAPGLTAAWVEYGVRFAAVAGSGRIWGVQAHPEKSQRAGETILRNFRNLDTSARTQGDARA